MKSFVADDRSRLTLLLLRRLTSPSLALKVLKQKAEREGLNVSNELLNRKAEGVASAVESGLGYWDVVGQSLNATLLLRYYAVVQFTIAEQVAALSNEDDLKAVQKHTRQGHGLASFALEGEASFPESRVVALVQSGHFAEYFQSLGLPAREMAMVRPKSEPVPRQGDAIKKSATFADLFRRIPEVRQLVHEHLGVKPLVFGVSYMSEMEYAFKVDPVGARRASVGKRTAEGGSSVQCSNLMLHPEEGVIYSLEEIRALKLGVEEIVEVEEEGRKVFLCKHRHTTKFWQESLKPYSSRMSGMTLVDPLWGYIRDPYLIHALVLYGLSIVVRYLPDVWHEIASGDLDAFRSLVGFYIEVVDALIPRSALERITGELISIEQSGSLFAPV